MNPPDIELDVCRQSCPVPLIRLALEVANLVAGQRIRVRGDDPIFEQSIADFCQARNFHVVEKQCDNGVFTFILQP